MASGCSLPRFFRIGTGSGSTTRGRNGRFPRRLPGCWFSPPRRLAHGGSRAPRAPGPIAAKRFQVCRGFCRLPQAPAHLGQRIMGPPEGGVEAEGGAQLILRLAPASLAGVDASYSIARFREARVKSDRLLESRQRAAGVRPALLALQEKLAQGGMEMRVPGGESNRALDVGLRRIAAAHAEQQVSQVIVRFLRLRGKRQGFLQSRDGPRRVKCL